MVGLATKIQWFLLLVLPFTAAAETDPVNEARAYLETFLTKETPGCVAHVSLRGKTAFSEGFGVASFSPSDTPEKWISQNQRFRVASVTKPIIATAVLILRDRKLPSLDILNLTLADFYPVELKGTPFAAMTLRQLLDHTSGLTREPAEIVLSAADLPKAMAVAPEKWLNGSAPGTRFDYSNLGYMILADVIEKLSGARLQDFMNDAIFLPLGMRSSLFTDPVPLHQSGELAKGYGSGAGKFVYQKIDTIRRRLLGSGGLLTTAEDLSRFTRAVEEKTLLSSDSWREAFTPSQPSVIAHEPYGLGWTLPSSSTKEHMGGGFGAYTLVQIKPVGACGFTTIILCNFNSGTLSGFTIKTVAQKMESLFCP